jgi:hypothetical protein
VTAGAIYAAFGGRTESLIPLYAVGVFLAFTPSQTSMVVRWWRGRGEGWAPRMAINAVGGILSGVVLAIAAITKFGEGAWVVVFGSPLLVWLAVRIGRHSAAVRQAVVLHRMPDHAARAVVPAIARGARQPRLRGR